MESIVHRNTLLRRWSTTLSKILLLPQYRSQKIQRSFKSHRLQHLPNLLRKSQDLKHNKIVLVAQLKEAKIKRRKKNWLKQKYQRRKPLKMGII